MEQLPPPFARLVRPLLATLALSLPAAAQIPVTLAPADLAPAPAAPPAAVEAAGIPEPPPAPSGSNPPPSASQPTPAKADQLKQPSTAPSDAPLDDEIDEDEGSYSEAPRRTWYGWQTLTADGISTMLLVTALGMTDTSSEGSAEALAWAGLLSYELAPGIVHFAHKNPGRGFASLGIRLGMPLAGAFLGGAMASGCRGYECEAGGAGVGFLLGMAGAIAIDAAVLAYDYPESHGPGTARLLPLVSLTPGRAFLGLAGEL